MGNNSKNIPGSIPLTDLPMGWRQYRIVTVTSLGALTCYRHVLDLVGIYELDCRRVCAQRHIVGLDRSIVLDIRTAVECRAVLEMQGHMAAQHDAAGFVCSGGHEYGASARCGTLVDSLLYGGSAEAGGIADGSVIDYIMNGSDGTHRRSDNYD